MDYYTNYYYRMLTVSEEMRKACKEHWTKCHRENLKSGRKDLIIFSVQMLGSIALAEEDLQKGNILVLEVSNG